VRRFVQEQIQSPEQLDILLLLHGAPEREWTAGDVSRAVYTVPASATLRLESLVAAGFLASRGGADPAYRFAPRTPALRATVDALCAAYRENRVAVINLVLERRADPLRSFANAFRLK
jgi:hypothetical protein